MDPTTPTDEYDEEDFDTLAGFTPKQQLATAAADTHRFTLFGGARGPGKSRWLRWWLLRFLLDAYNRLDLTHVHVGLFCEDYPVLRDRQISKIRYEFPTWLGEVKETQDDGLGYFLYPEYGSGVLSLRNLDDPSKYQSAEFAAIAIDELTKNPLSTFNVLRGSLRWPGIKYPPLVAGTNPGGIGHLWVKAYFIDGQFPAEMLPLAAEFAFIKALPSDNQHLDEQYWLDLATLPPDLAAAWVEGSWDVFEGMAFRHWNRARHVVAAFDIPAHWPRWRAVDWGKVNPFCCLWLALDPDTGRVYVYRELYLTDLTDRQQARLILANSPPAEKINITYADPSMWTKKTFEDTTFSTADEYGAEKVWLTRADNDRLTGKRKVDTMLMDLPDGRPGVCIFEACENLIRTLPGLPYDRTNVEDVDSSSEDHAYDSLRYGLTNVNPRPRPVQTQAQIQDALARRVPAVQRLIGGGGGMRSSDL